MHRRYEIVISYLANSITFQRWLLGERQKVEESGRRFIPMEHLDNNSYEAYIRWNIRLQAMEDVLGLTKDQIARLDDLATNVARGEIPEDQFGAVEQGLQICNLHKMVPNKKRIELHPVLWNPLTLKQSG